MFEHSIKTTTSAPGTFWASPWLTIPAPVLGSLFAVVLWLLLPPSDVMFVMREGSEGGVIEGMTEKLYFALAAAMWLSPRQTGEWRTTLAITLLLIGAGAREMDLHKALTGFSVLKVSFYLHDRPWHHKLIAFFCVALVAGAAIYLLLKYRRVLWERFKRLEPVTSGLAIFFATLVISKVLDRSISILDEVFGIPSSLEVLALVSALEESIELTLPVMAGLMRWQYLKLYKHGAPAQPEQGRNNA